MVEAGKRIDLPDGKNLWLLGQIGEGHFGEVWAALDDLFELKAVKFLKMETIASQSSTLLASDMRTRFRREGENIIFLDHANIAKAHFYSQFDDIPFIVYDYYGYGNLEEFLENNPSLTIWQRFEIFSRILDGFEYLHSQKIIHRDVKAANILMDHVVPKISDLGIANFGDLATTCGLRLTEHLASLGTEAVMPPEQRKNPAQADERSDIYSLGLLLGTILSDRQVVNQDLFDLRALRTLLEIAAFGITCPGIASIVEKCTKQIQAERYQSIRELRKDCDRFIAFLKTFENFWQKGYSLLNVGLYSESLEDFVMVTCPNCGAGPVILIRAVDWQDAHDCVDCRLRKHALNNSND